MSGELLNDLEAAFGLAYRADVDRTRRRAHKIVVGLVDHLIDVGVTDVSEIDVATLNRWVATARDGPVTSLTAVARRILGVFDPQLLHASLLIGERFDWSPHRPATAVAVTRSGRRSWVDPAAHPHVGEVAEGLCRLLSDMPDRFSFSYADTFARAVRSLLGWLEACPAPPDRLEWLTADLLDGWISHLKVTTPSNARVYGLRIRDLLTNRPGGLRLHASLLAADGMTVVWEPDAITALAVAEDVPFSTVAAVHDAARTQLRAAVARITTIERVARIGRAPNAGGDWQDAPDVWRLALDGRLDVRGLAAALGDDPAGWPDWLVRVLPPDKPTARSWPTIAVAAVHEQVFPTGLEVASGYVLMLLATGLPPESVMALEHGWFLVARRADGGYGPVCRLRYPKDRAGGPTQARLYTTRTALSPLRVRDLVARMTGGLARLAGDQLDSRLWPVLSPRPLRLGRTPEITTLDRITLPDPQQRGRGGAFTAWVGTHGIDDVDRMSAWNRQRAARHAARQAEHHRRAAARGPLVGLLGVAPLRPYAAWPGRVTPQRLRKTIRVRDLVLHGPYGAARDHTTLTLLRHYTASETLQVVAATAVRDAQAMLETFAADATPRLLAATDQAPTVMVAALLDLDPGRLGQLLAGDATRMRNGLVCTTPTAPPDGHGVGDEGWCRQLGTAVCTTCPAALAVPAGVDELWAELRRGERTAHLAVDNPAVAHAAATYRRVLLDVLEVLDPEAVASSGIPDAPPAADVDTTLPGPPRRRRRA